MFRLSTSIMANILEYGLLASTLAGTLTPCQMVSYFDSISINLKMPTNKYKTYITFLRRKKTIGTKPHERH